jgi:hypothetical protein
MNRVIALLQRVKNLNKILSSQSLKFADDKETWETFGAGLWIPNVSYADSA